MDHTIINHYFPHLTPQQQMQFAALGPCYQDWNARINVVSRKDIDQLYVHHILHSLAIARFISFPAGAQVLDVGTGGGFPGIPLAILFPQTHFFLCDSIAKKIRVVNQVQAALGLTNVSTAPIRVQEVDQTFDFVVSRAVTRLDQLLPWVWNKVRTGILCLKGGDLREELEASIRTMNIPQTKIDEVFVSQWFAEPFFEEKKIVYISK